MTSVFIGWRSSGSQYVPLGHMLTFKVAYQIVTGLAYLHRKNIIFCDLKSDNILVWSLELEESVNVKLSDYGISRQSFHEGALGVEGTPGYQAPEIRPGIVYDEKVRPDPMSLIGCPSSFSVTAEVTVSIQAEFRFRGYMLSQDPVFKLPSWSYNASFHIDTRKWCSFGYMLSTDKMQECPRRNYA